MPSANVVKGGSKKSKLLILAVNEINAKINSLLFLAHPVCANAAARDESRRQRPTLRSLLCVIACKAII